MQYAKSFPTPCVARVEMSKKKQQYYVPKSYLRLFCGRREKIYVYDKKTNKCFLTSINETQIW